MNKEELFQELAQKIASGEVRREEIMEQLGYVSAVSPKVEHESEGWKKHFSLTKILYFLGTSIAFLGIIFFVAQVWDDIGSFGRILITFILGLILAGTGSIFLNSKPESYLGQVFHVIAGLLIPGGALVTLSELSTDFISLWPVTITIGVIFIFYLLLTLYHKIEVLTFFAIANGTAFTYLLVESIIEGPFYRHDDIHAYLTMFIGLSYLLLAYSFRVGWNKRLVGVLNFFGIAGFFGAAFSRVFESGGIWELLFFILAVGGMVLAVQLKSRSILVVSTFFLIGHFAYITNEYFADSIGWPISLVVLGFLFIGLGYASITISKKYIGDASGSA